MKLIRISDHVRELPRQTFYGEAVHIYVIEQDECAVVVDGPDARLETIEALTALGKPLKVVLSHGPAARDIARLKRKWPVAVYLHEDDRLSPWLTIDLRECTLWSGKELRITPCVTVFHTPGHTAGSCCIHYSEDGGILFTGDAIYGDSQGNIRVPDAWGSDWNTPKNMESLRALCHRLEFQMILPFHYDIIPTKARWKLQRALATIQPA